MCLQRHDLCPVELGFAQHLGVERLHPRSSPSTTSMSCSPILMSFCVRPTAAIFRFGSDARSRLRQLPGQLHHAFPEFRQARDVQVLPGLRRDLLERPGLDLERAGELRPDCDPHALRPDLHPRRAEHHGRKDPDQRARNAHSASDHAPSAGAGDILEAVHSLRPERHELMTDTVEHRVERLERDFVEILGSLDRIERNLAENARNRRQDPARNARSVAPVAQDAPDGTVAIRDPDIIAQQQRTEMRGYSRPRPRRHR